MSAVEDIHTGVIAIRHALALPLGELQPVPADAKLGSLRRWDVLDEPPVLPYSNAPIWMVLASARTLLDAIRGLDITTSDHAPQARYLFGELADGLTALGMQITFNVEPELETFDQVPDRRTTDPERLGTASHSFLDRRIEGIEVVRLETKQPSTEKNADVTALTLAREFADLACDAHRAAVAWAWRARVTYQAAEVAQVAEMVDALERGDRLSDTLDAVSDALHVHLQDGESSPFFAAVRACSARVADAFVELAGADYDADCAPLWFRKAFLNRKHLAALLPTDITLLRGLAAIADGEIYFLTAPLPGWLGDPFLFEEGHAYEWFGECLEIHERLMNLDPTYKDSLRDLANAFCEYLDADEADENGPATEYAREWFRKVIEVQQRLAALEPDNTAYRDALTASTSRLSELTEIP